MLLVPPLHLPQKRKRTSFISRAVAFTQSTRYPFLGTCSLALRLLILHSVMYNCLQFLLHVHNARLIAKVVVHALYIQ